MTAGQLITALEEGKIIFIDHKKVFPEQYRNSNVGERVRSIVMTKSNDIFRFGWGTELESDRDEIMNIIKHPEQYQIKEEI